MIARGGDFPRGSAWHAHKGIRNQGWRRNPRRQAGKTATQPASHKAYTPESVVPEAGFTRMPDPPAQCARGSVPYSGMQMSEVEGDQHADRLSVVLISTLRTNSCQPANHSR